MFVKNVENLNRYILSCLEYDYYDIRQHYIKIKLNAYKF